MPGCATPTCCTRPTSTTTSRCWSSAASATTSAAARICRSSWRAMTIRRRPGCARSRLDGDATCTYPPKGTFRNGATISQWYANPRGGLPHPAGVQEDQHRRGQGLLLRLALLPVRRRRPGDLLRRRAVRPRRVPLRTAGAPRMWTWVQTMGLRKFQEMVFTGRPFTAAEMDELQLPQQGGAARPARGRDRRSTPWPARGTGPTDTVFMQKIFFEIYEAAPGRVHGQPARGVLRVDGQRRTANDRATEISTWTRPSTRADRCGQGQRRASSRPSSG